MGISREQFDVLSAIAVGETPKNTQLMSEFEKCGYILNNTVTELGLKELEPYRVKSAVFLAAGFGSRLLPITINTPKPLVNVLGTSFIERMINACNDVGIENIYVVVGHLKENFSILKNKFPNIHLIENNKYDIYGTIYSVYRALDYIDNSYLIESDLLLFNPKLIKKYHYCSNGLGIKVDKTDDWCWITEDKRIVDCKIGYDDNCHQLIGINYFDHTASMLIKKYVKDTVENKTDGEKNYFGTIMFKEHIKEYYHEIRECFREDVLEIDTFDELKAVDKRYDV